MTNLLFERVYIIKTPYLFQPHVTVLEKYGKPDDAMVGVKRHKESLPPVPLSGMYNQKGGKVRLTFKMEQDQLWIGTKGIFIFFMTNKYVYRYLLVYGSFRNVRLFHLPLL